MTLFEMITSRIGESFVRCYVWAKSEIDARKIFEAAYPDQKLKDCRFCFNAGDQPFFTSLSDCEFGGIRMVESQLPEIMNQLGT